VKFFEKCYFQLEGQLYNCNGANFQLEMPCVQLEIWPKFKKMKIDEKAISGIFHYFSGVVRAFNLLEKVLSAARSENNDVF